MNQKSVRITSALTALSAIAAAVVAIVAVNSSGVLSAQSTTTTIDLLNVGMCVTTDKSIFKEADCNDGDDDDSFNVGDRDEIVVHDEVYATYAGDPTANDVRAIVTNSDLLKVSISDPGRDRRRTVIYPVNGFEDILVDSDNTNNTQQTALLNRIKSLLGDSVDDEDALTDFENDDINVRALRSRLPNKAVIASSGNATLLFYRDDTDSMADQFLPLSVAKNDEGEWIDTVQWYGYVVDSGTSLTVDKAYVLTNAATLSNLGASRPRNLIADEDRTSGDTVLNIAPWMVVQANVQPTKEIHIVAVAYETSDREIITGGDNCAKYSAEDLPPSGSSRSSGDCKPNRDQAKTSPNFTKSEVRGKGDDLVAEVEGEGAALRLSLKETAPFSGTYTGFVRITDADGNGRGAVKSRSGSDNRTLSFQNAAASNWGRLPADAIVAPGNDDPAAAHAAVVPVNNRLTIKYKDSKGSTREIRVAIDNAPPEIRVNSPEDDTSDDDRSPDFIGTIVDAESGLAEDTFKLYVDNIADGDLGDPGERIDEQATGYVLDIPADSTSTVARFTNTARVTTYRGYTGWSDTYPTFGILNGNRDSGNSMIYFDEDEGDSPAAHLTDDDAQRKIVLADDYDDGDLEAAFDNDARIEGTDDEDATIAGREVEVDFQAVVIDLAGNIGFSDADPNGPDYINDLGTLEKDRLDNDKNGRLPNVLGKYSRHVILIDDKDPEFNEDNPALTGFYGLDKDEEPMPHSRGIMLTFDNKVSEETISENTFTVELDDKSSATVDNYMVEDNRVFLRLTADLKTSETPKIGIASGHRIEDEAGNQLHARELSEEIEALDGLPPKLTVTLSGGSGSGEGDESPSGLTDENIDVTVSADEKLSVAHYSVLCANFRYDGKDEDERDVTKGLNDFIQDRSGSLVGGKPANPGRSENAKCGTARDASVFDLREEDLRPVSGSDTLRDRWSNQNRLPNGELTVVVYARDESEYRLDPLDEDSDESENWSTVTATFTFDTELNPLVVRNMPDTNAGRVLPTPRRDDEKVSVNRPLILLEFKDASKVTLQKLLVDGIDVTARASADVRNQFIYQPGELSKGLHKVEVDAMDAAGNETTFRYEFDIDTLAAFEIRLYAGWNAVSVPQQPINGRLEDVFSDPNVTRIISYERKSADTDPQWAFATREDGVWTMSYNNLTEIRAGVGYWVYAEQFVNQSVRLRGPERLSADVLRRPIGITTGPGWNFVGVVDQEGDQIQAADWGQSYTLTVTRQQTVNGQPRNVEAKEAQNGEKYLGQSYVRAYTWDPRINQFKVLAPTNDVKIGDGIWVFYGTSSAGGVAP